MGICAYCGMNRTLTREHLIPQFIDKELGPGEQWIDRVKGKYINGAATKKDVCRECNNNALGALDGYAKELYSKYFHFPVFADQTISFDCDVAKFCRWLLKVSYNSARIHNTDCETLSLYRESIISDAPWPGSLYCFASIICPAIIELDGTTRPAYSTDPDPIPAHTFRISQIRFLDHHVMSCVQRCIIINSYCFYIIAFPIQATPEEDECVKRLIINCHKRNATAIEQSAMPITLRPGGWDSISSTQDHIILNPEHYGLCDNTMNNQLDKSPSNTVFLIDIPRGVVESGNIAFALSRLLGVLSSRDTVLGYKQRLEVTFNGYNEDPRPIWVIPEIRQYLLRVHSAFNHWFYFIDPRFPFLKVLPFCLCTPASIDGKWEIKPADMKHFMEEGYDALNKLCDRFVIDHSINKKISEDIARFYLEKGNDFIMP